MRWHAAPPSRFDGALAAVPVTLLSREEDAHHPVHLYSKTQGLSRRGQPSKAAVATAPVGPREPRRPSMATAETIRLRTTIVPSLRPSLSQKPQLSARDLSPRGLGSQEESHDGEPHSETSETSTTKFLVCAGRGLSNNDDDEDSNYSNGFKLPIHSVSNNPDVVVSEPLKSQRGLQRSDSELELIISELREKIALQQRQSTTPRSPSGDEEPATTSSSSRPGSANQNQHSRKHLKNPLERMHLSSSSSLNGLLRRQASTSQVTASRLVSEGTATMVTPAVLSSSASRSGIASHPQQTQPLAMGTEGYDGRDKPTPAHYGGDSIDEMGHDGLRIRSYAGGDGASSHMPQFVSSTSLGLNLPSQQQPVRGLASGTETVEPQGAFAQLRRQSKPRLRTMADLELELERLNDDSRGDDASGSLSPVGPWLVDHDSLSGAPLASSRSTSSLSSSSSSSQLTAEDTALSPRSRLLWLSDCGSDEVWDAASARVVAMLRPGTRTFFDGNTRPASALETRRRLSNSKLVKTPVAKPRATSAKAASASRRNSSHSVNESPLLNAAHSSRQTSAMAMARGQRPRRYSSSTGSTGTSNNSNSTNSSAGRQRVASRP